MNYCNNKVGINAMEDLEGLDFNINISNKANNSESEKTQLGGETGNWDQWGTETEETKGKNIILNTY